MRPESEWPLMKEFLDYVPSQELRSPKAAFNVAEP